MARYLLVDGNHLAGRCHAVNKELTTADGRRSGLLHGFLMSLSYSRNKVGVGLQHTLICWDGGRSVERKRIYPAYKGGRRKDADDQTEDEKEEWEHYAAQMAALSASLEFVEVKQIRTVGVEADDLLSIFGQLLTDQKQHVVVLSGDHDMHQLSGERLQIFDPKKELLSTEAVEAWWKLPVHQFVLYKALVGDNSDNISGIKSIGDVRARLICDYENDQPLTWTLDHVKDKDRKWVELAIDNIEVIKRNIRLMRLPRSWDESFYDLDQAEHSLQQFLCSGKDADRSKFIQFLMSWELQKVLQNINRW